MEFKGGTPVYAELNNDEQLTARELNPMLEGLSD